MGRFNPNNELRIYGKSLCKTLFKTRASDIITFFVTEKVSKEFKTELAFLAKNKKSYHLVSREELETLTKSTHHEDVCLVVKKKSNLSFDQLLKNIKKDSSHLIVALENVSNPHNLGAIMRGMAHFKAKTLLITESKKLDNAAALRTSEGGAEFVDIVEVKDLNAALQNLQKEKFDILSTSSHTSTGLYSHQFNPKTVLLFGEEGPGLSKSLIQSFKSINIDGSGNVESLNVSVACAIILAEYYRQNI